MFLIIALSITGCAVGPDYRKPSTALRPFHASAAPKGRRTSASAPALAQWWLGFDDPEQDEGRYSTLVADADGTIIDTLAEPGQYVAAGQVVLELAHSGPREASIDLPETLRPAIGSRAVAILYGKSAPVPVHLRQLSDAADPLTRTFEARYVLEGPAAQAPLGANFRRDTESRWAATSRTPPRPIPRSRRSSPS
jgi:multidrug efflux pump subunit AcrA (membrane-fusion protein)